jgi:hypothetical protein
VENRRINPEEVTFVKMEKGKAVYEIGSGSYVFVVKK